MRKQTEKEKALEDYLYGMKVLMLMECPDDCTHYHQVILTPEVFAGVSKVILGEKHDTDGGNVTLHPRTIKSLTLDELQGTYRQEEIAKLEEESQGFDHDHEETA